MAVTKHEAAARAARKILGNFSPTQGVPWSTLRQAAEKQVAALRRRNDLAYTVSLNEAAGLLALEPDRLRRLLRKHPFGPPPLFSRPASKVAATQGVGTAKAPRKPNTIERCSLLRLFEWHDALVADGSIEPVGERIHPDARVGGTEPTFVARDRSVLTVRAPFLYSRDKRGNFKITGVADPDDLRGLLRSLGGREVHMLFLSFPTAFELPWQVQRIRQAVADVYIGRVKDELAAAHAHLAALEAARLAAVLPPADANRPRPRRL